MNTTEERKKIFIIDDEEHNLKYFKRILSKEFTVITENDSRDCLPIIKSVKPDIILLDVHMPVISGFELCKLIVNDEVTRNIPVIFVSSLRTSEHVKIGLEAGAVDFISRPINKVELFARIKTHLTIGQLQKDLAHANNKLNSSLTKKVDELKEEKWLSERSRAALHESENRFKVIFQGTPEAIIIVSLESGEIIDVNPAGCELSGYSFDELVGMDQTKLLQPSTETIQENYFQSRKNVASGSNVRMSLNTLIRKSGKNIPVQNSSKTILIEGELYIFGVIFDLSARRNMENDLLKAKEEAEEFSRIKGFFLANMSHELRTPLVGMLGFSNILEEELEDKHLKNMAHSITSSGKRLLNTLKVLLDYSVLENLKSQPNWELVDLNKIICKVVDSYRDSFNDSGLEVTTNCNEKDIFISADEYFMTEVISQILNNAIIYTHHGSINIMLETEQINNINYAIISIKDTGIGIGKDKLNSIFEDFRQGSEGYSRDYEGLGMGLALVKNIVDLHSGKITVQSKENEGSLFQIKLEIKNGNLTKR